MNSQNKLNPQRNSPPAVRRLRNASSARCAHRSTSSRTKAAVAAPDIVWNGAEYPKLDAGVRLVRVHAIQGPEWVRRFSRWSLRLECRLTDEEADASIFFNLGTYRASPSIGRGRQSKYYRAWVLANGGEPPRKGQSMEPSIFIDKFFYARVENCKRDSDGNLKDEAAVYSLITDFVKLA